MATDIITARDVNDAKFGVVSDDAAYLVPTTFDSPGINGIDLEVEYDEDEAYGDGEVLDYFAKARKVTGTITQAQLGLQAAAAMFGGNYIAGTGFFEADIYAGVVPPYLAMDIQSLYQGGPDAGGPGDYHLLIYKFRVIKPKFSLKTGYLEFSCDLAGIFPRNVVNPSADSGDQKRRLIAWRKNTSATAAAGSLFPTS